MDFKPQCDCYQKREQSLANFFHRNQSFDRTHFSHVERPCVEVWLSFKNQLFPPGAQQRREKINGGRAHYIIESKVQWKPFWLATQLYPQNDWLGGNFPYTMTYAHGPIRERDHEWRHIMFWRQKDGFPSSVYGAVQVLRRVWQGRRLASAEKRCGQLNHHRIAPTLVCHLALQQLASNFRQRDFGERDYLYWCTICQVCGPLWPVALRVSRESLHTM